MEMHNSASTSLSSGSLIEIKEFFEPSPGCCISRVPINLRKVNEEAYTPQLIAIGPFHKDKRELFGMEKEKRRYNNKFIQRLADNNSWEQLKTFVENHEQEIRQYYSEFIELSSAMFVEMILCDAVFIIELFLRFYRREKDDFLLNKLRLKAIRRDLLLVENQIPYFVLEELYNLAFQSTAQDVAASATPDGAYVTLRSYTSNPEAEEATASEQERATIQNPKESTFSNPEEAIIDNLDEATTSDPEETTTNNPNEATTSIQEKTTTINPNEATNSNQEEAATSSADEASTNSDEELLLPHCNFLAIFYFLQGLHKRAPNNEEIEVTAVGASTIDPDRKLLRTSFFTLPYHFFVLHGWRNRREIKFKHFTDLYRHALVEIQIPTLDGANTEGLHHRESFYAIDIPEDLPAQKDLPNAVKLQDSGVKFKPLSTKSLVDINLRNRRFPFFNGVEMQIPCIEINDDTEYLIRNAIALEQCHYPSETYLRSYIELMNFLIYSVKDVDLLVEEGIIRNLVGENLVIVDLFNNLRQQIPEGGSHYSGFYEHLRAHYSNGWNHIGADLGYILLKTPWRAMATIVGAILVLPTLIENILSIIWYTT